MKVPTWYFWENEIVADMLELTQDRNKAMGKTNQAIYGPFLGGFDPFWGQKPKNRTCVIWASTDPNNIWSWEFKYIELYSGPCF